ncbi:hypothetical protein [Candidatus Phyllobacterium onerii]|uniref:hypothetical protein n=1 Tax=Candidatus Phyllobacterium onerii TaxID=3020828 RepID=UPI00232F6D25|nr:hypothetical protein [Phyllobacterium sp. IY22]
MMIAAAGLKNPIDIAAVDIRSDAAALYFASSLVSIVCRAELPYLFRNIAVWFETIGFLGQDGSPRLMPMFQWNIDPSNLQLNLGLVFA